MTEMNTPVLTDPVDIDLDALRRAKADGKRTKTFRLDGQTYEVAGKLPAYVGILLASGEPRAALRLWLGDAQEAKLSATDIDQDEIRELIKDLYSVTTGESEASDGTSPSTEAS